jgi:hypothetical protein
VRFESRDLMMNILPLMACTDPPVTDLTCLPPSTDEEGCPAPTKPQCPPPTKPQCPPPTGQGAVEDWSGPGVQNLVLLKQQLQQALGGQA